MKKIALVLIFVVIATMSWGQGKIYPVANTKTQVGVAIAPNNFVYDLTGHKLYEVKTGMVWNQTIESAHLTLVNVGATGATGPSLTDASTLMGKDTTNFSKLRIGSDTAGWNANKAGDIFITTGGNIFISKAAGLHKWVKTGPMSTNASTLQGKDTTVISKIRTASDTAGWNATKAGDIFIKSNGDIFISKAAGLHKWVKVN